MKVGEVQRREAVQVLEDYLSKILRPQDREREGIPKQHSLVDGKKLEANGAVKIFPEASLLLCPSFTTCTVNYSGVDVLLLAALTEYYLAQNIESSVSATADDYITQLKNIIGHLHVRKSSLVSSLEFCVNLNFNMVTRTLAEFDFVTWTLKTGFEAAMEKEKKREQLNEFSPKLAIDTGLVIDKKERQVCPEKDCGWEEIAQYPMQARAIDEGPTIQCQCFNPKGNHFWELKS